MEEEYLTVSQINAYIKKKLNQDGNLKNIYVKGEISNYKTYPTGHSYFTLKDENSQISGVMFENYKKKFLKFEPENGMNVIIKGKIEVYIKNGKYQLQAFRIIEDGIGDLHVAFEQLKKRLSKEGLFREEHKKEIPKYPERIGVVTAETGAAVKDIITTIKRRYPLCEILVFSTLVQGNQAADQIVRQIKHAQKYDLDTLIVGRGGGSIEDLWPFNEEKVAREIFNCKIPVISAVGHEIDWTISDYVADLRAPTPTAAGELAVPKLAEIKSNINYLSHSAQKSINEKLKTNKIKIEAITQKQILKNPENIYNIKGMNLDNLVHKLNFTSKKIINENKNRLFQLENSYILKNPTEITKRKKETYYKSIDKIKYNSDKILSENKNKLFKLENSFIIKNPDELIKRKQNKFLRNVDKLDVLNPLLTLKRGYSIAKSEDKVISSVKDVKKGDELDIEFDDGTINTKVI